MSQVERPPDILSMDEVCERYPGQWVIVRVTAWDEQAGIPSAGQVVAHGDDKKVKETLKALPSPDNPDRPYYLFLASPRVRSPEDWRGVIARAAEQGNVSAWRR